MKFDFVIIGSGMGGLVCGHLLADHGYSVCVLEKNQQIGGSLQVFSRSRTLFDTGVHYVGGLDEGLPLQRIFKHLGLMEGVKWQRMDSHHDRFTYADDPTEYYHAQGWETFKQALNDQFPAERTAIEKYMEAIKRMLDNFPLDSLRLSERDHMDDSLLQVNARDFIASITTDERLRALLGGANMLHAGTDRLPFYVHALVTGGYMHSAHKCVDGGSQMAQVLAKGIRLRGGQLLTRKEVIRFEMEGGSVRAAITADGERFEGTRFISDIHPITVLGFVGNDLIRPSTFNRLARMPHTVSSFNAHIVCKPQSFPYLNYNHYHHSTTDVWARARTGAATWPDAFMLSTPATTRSTEWAEGISVMTYMQPGDVAQWQETHNTIMRPGERGAGYSEFKEQMADRLIAAVERRCPGIRHAMGKVYCTTPLTFRDFLGTHGGALYGYAKDHRFPLRGFMSPATRIPNLFLTGQHIHLHGIQGVTMSALVTCSQLLGRAEVLRTVSGQ